MPTVIPEIGAQRFELAPFGQPDLTVVVKVEPSRTGKTWRVRWFAAGLDAGAADGQLYERTKAAPTPDVFEVFSSHKETLGNSAEIVGNRSGGSATDLTAEAAFEIAGAARATYADALARPFKRFSFETVFQEG